jgi:hypothetical protein
MITTANASDWDDFWNGPDINDIPTFRKTNMTDLTSEAIEVMETIEDSVEFICSENQLSGQKVWTMIAALADAKLAQFPTD